MAVKRVRPDCKPSPMLCDEGAIGRAFIFRVLSRTLQDSMDSVVSILVMPDTVRPDTLPPTYSFNCKVFASTPASTFFRVQLISSRWTTCRSSVSEGPVVKEITIAPIAEWCTC
jgi:hypothetical protein